MAKRRTNLQWQSLFEKMKAAVLPTGLFAKSMD
ncbi:hypothetical protein VAA_04088 [Vibrio anguillarum 775]|nr:hypothetical protein VAA_04088 [Vibrio anguillarum 775]